VGDARRRAGDRGARRELRVGAFGRLDLERERRTGVPEVILAEGKSPEHLRALAEAVVADGGTALISRPAAGHRRALEAAARHGLPVEFRAHGRIVRIGRGGRGRPTRGPVALLAAGTSDVPIAEEAREVLLTLGIDAPFAYDVGVAGLHRLQTALRRLERLRPRAYLVFAGREGALPTVVAGLVHAPVVGIPIAVGYGRGGRGEAALAAMLQSCAPLAVVNIDAGVPAALFAAQLVGATEPAPGVRRGSRRPARARPRSGAPPS
jgi:NCAIR mutase (PurE)-related protein